MRRVLLILALLAAILSPITPALADTEGTVTGTFGINAAPSVTSVSLVQTAMTPQTQYTISVVVSEPDTIADLYTVVLKMWRDADGGLPTQGEFDAATADVQNCVVVTWTHTGGTASTNVLTPAGTTWVLGACTVPTTNPHFNGTSFTFQFVVTVGKVATETSGSALWQIAARATDDISQTGWNKDGEGAAMNWYGEITVPPTTVNWGGLPPGTAFADSQRPVGVTLTHIANGPYDEKVRSSATWAGATYTAALDATGSCANSNEFALMADDTATLGSAILVNTAGVVIDDTGLQTLEAGDSAANNTLWLKLASTFNKDVYSGIITYIIANGD